MTRENLRLRRECGYIAEMDMPGKVKDRTSMMLRFDRLVMPDGRRTPIHAEIVELYHAQSGEKAGVEGAIESSRKIAAANQQNRDRKPLPL